MARTESKKVRRAGAASISAVAVALCGGSALASPTEDVSSEMVSTNDAAPVAAVAQREKTGETENRDQAKFIGGNLLAAHFNASESALLAQPGATVYASIAIGYAQTDFPTGLCPER